jgi:3-hydroxyacyl-CoA dehydrogenase
MLLMMEASEGNWEEIHQMVRTFQRATRAIKYNLKPFGSAFRHDLGGLRVRHLRRARSGCRGSVYRTGGSGRAATAGGGTTEMLARGSNHIREVFQNIGLARVSTSAEDARRLRYLRPGDGITMNSDRLIHDAKAIVIEMASSGYRPPMPVEIPVLGIGTAAELKLGIHLIRKAATSPTTKRDRSIVWC